MSQATDTLGTPILGKILEWNTGSVWVTAGQAVMSGAQHGVPRKESQPTNPNFLLQRGDRTGTLEKCNRHSISGQDFRPGLWLRPREASERERNASNEGGSGFPALNRRALPSALTCWMMLTLLLCKIRAHAAIGVGDTELGLVTYTRLGADQGPKETDAWA